MESCGAPRLTTTDSVGRSRNSSAKTPAEVCDAFFDPQSAGEHLVVSGSTTTTRISCGKPGL
jgi:hypothetical protein